MSTKIFCRDGGKTTEIGATRLLRRLFNGSGVLSSTELLVEQQTVADNTIKVAAGDCVIEDNAPSSSTYIYHGWNTAAANVTIDANTSGNPRIDYIVAYVDLAVIDSGTDDNDAALKFADVNGTPAGSPAVPTSGQIETEVGAGNPYIILAQIAVANGFATIVTANITDKREIVDDKDGWKLAAETWAYASATTITVPSGAASKYSIGDKIKLTQTTVKYFYITAVADTVLTVTGGTDYTVANATISANYYSKDQSPVGFPGGFVLATNKYLTMDGKNAKVKIFSSIQGTGATNAGATITYGITFTTLKSVTVSCSGRKNTSAPADITETTLQSSELCTTKSATTSQTDVYFENINAGTIANTIWIGFSLVVEGVI